MKQREWIGIADLMSGLMMIFLFIAVAYMIEIRREQRYLEEIALTYEQTRRALHVDLEREFRRHLHGWHAEVTEENTVVFYAPEVLFHSGSSEITKEFSSILDSFFPRYFRIVGKYRDAVDEIRIEGHTSSVWAGSKSEKERYINNMRLSQQRSLKVLEYCYATVGPGERGRFRKLVHANGMADSRPAFSADGSVDPARSRRVEFRTVTRAQERIEKILERIGTGGAEALLRDGSISKEH